MDGRLLVVYEGQTQRVSAQSLLTSLLSLIALIEEVKSELPQYKDYAKELISAFPTHIRIPLLIYYFFTFDLDRLIALKKGLWER